MFASCPFAPQIASASHSSSSNAAPAVENLALWLKADSGATTIADGLVRRWVDQSGKGNDAIQTNSVSMPRWVKEAAKSQPALRFDGITNFLEIAPSRNLTATNGAAIFAVLRVDDLAAHHGIIGKTSHNLPAPFDFYLEPPLGQPRLFTGNGTNWSWVYGHASISPGQWTLVSSVFDATNQTIFLNGVFNGSKRVGTNLKEAGGTTRIGTRDDFGPWLKGDLAEILFIAGSVSDGERTALHNYLGNKYGIDMGLNVPVPVVRQWEGQTASFSTPAISSSQTVHYQWQRDGVDIPGATNLVYTTPPLTLADHNSSYRTRLSIGQTNRYGYAVTLHVLEGSDPVTTTAAAFLAGESSSSPRTAIPPPYSSRFWPTGEAPSRNIIQSVAQTSDGFLWVGTAGGLARFDGEHFEFSPTGAPHRLENSKINALCAAPDGGLWVGTAGEGSFQLRDGNWIERPVPPELDANILALQKARDGSIWMGTRTGMALFQNEKLSLRDDQKDRIPGPEKNSYQGNVRSIAEDGNGDLWIAAGDHLMRLQNGAVVADFPLLEFNPTYLRSVCSRRDGSVWMGCNSGLVRLQDGKFTHFAKPSGLPDNVVMVVFEDSRNNLWIGTSGGLCRFVDGRFVVETTAEGEAYDQILCLFEDHENNLWVGAKNGLYQLRVQQFATYTTRHGLAHNNVISVCEDREGTMWIGTWGGGLHHVRDGKITIYSSAKNKTLRNDLILAIEGAHDGGVWFATDFDGGFYRLKDGHMTRYAIEQGFGPTAARDLWEDSAGRLVIGTARESVYLLQNGNVSKYVGENSVLSKDVRCLLEDRDGRMWIGTEAGLVCKVEDKLSRFTTRDGLSDDFILSLHEDHEGTLWVGTAKGLSRMRRDGKSFTSYTKHQGLFDNGVVEILEDNRENFWLATRDGVLRINRKDLNALDEGRLSKISSVVFGRADGMISPVCVGVAKPSALKSKDGRLWFATTKGLAVTDPELQIAKNEKPPPVVIQEVVVDKKIQRGLSILNLAPGQGELEFRYTALSYAAPEKNRFKYKLAGFDANWVEAGARRAAFYNSVPPGSYEFQVIACNNDGVWNTLGSSVKLSLQPHYWQTAWFRGLIGLTAFGLVAGTARYITWKRVRARLLQLEQQHAVEKERTRIAQDMHDELGARLTEIRVLSDLTGKSKDRPDEVETQSRRIFHATGELIRNLHCIVWAVNPANDSLEKLADYICGFAQPFLKGASIRCRFERPDTLPDCRLSSEVRHNIVMVIKEALNNTIKHGEASETRLALAVSNLKLTVSIADNGKGFQTGNASAFGNGLQNMKTRIESINGRYELLTEPGKGTTIRFEIPLPHAAAN